MSHQGEVAIVGGGIAGLAAAVALERIGLRARIFESAEQAQTGPGSLLLWPNGIKALRTLGLEDPVVEAGFALEWTEFRSSRGTLLGKLAVGDMSRRAGAPSLLISRADLVRILAAALGESSIAFGHTCTDVVPLRNEVLLSFAHRPSLRMPLVVGADGLNSVVRAQLLRDGPTRESGVRAYGGTVTLDHPAYPPGVSCSSIGRGDRFCISPCGERTVYWLANVNDATSTPLDRSGLVTRFARYHAPIAEIIAATPPAMLFDTRIRDRPPARCWGRGRVTLLGDAAHPSTPDLGQGACQALESAVVLARSLSEEPDVEVALRAYEHRRRPPTARVTSLSWIATTQSMRDERIYCWFRDLGTRPFLAMMARSELEELMRHAP